MSVSRLVELLETGHYRRCLEEALTLLAVGQADATERARIQAAICRCRAELGDWRAAAAAGEQALLLVGETADPDLLASILVDLGTAHARLRKYARALEAWDRFLELLPSLSGPRCQEGTVRMRMAEVLNRLGRSDRAREEYEAARRWFRLFGDEGAAWACARAVISICLEKGDLKHARRLLAEGDRQMPGAADEFRSGQLLDWARYLLAAGRPDVAAAKAFAALELAVGLEQQGEAQMLLCQAAQAQKRPVEALAFALAARVSAMEGNLYALEFDAAEVIFRLLREHGSELLDEVASDFAGQGVDIYDYLSELAIRRCVK